MAGNVCIPMHLDAFALSPSCCTGLDGQSRIAPYTQPNYTALRLDSHLIQHDLVDHVDFHTSAPANKNPRLADIGVAPGTSGTDNIKYNRTGVHLHWSIPRFYRAATASGRQTTTASDPSDPSNPVFRPIPDRWLVTRHLKNYQQANVLPEFQSWIIESNAVQKISEISDDTDLESDVSPFVSYQGNPLDPTTLNQQSEIFLGQKFDLVGYTGKEATAHMAGLTLMNSSNIYFPDYALHNTNVLSVLDNFRYKTNPTDTDWSYLATEADCDYFVVGWHSDPTADPLNQAAAADLANRLSGLMLQLDADSLAKYGASEDPTRCLIFGAVYDVTFNIATKPRSLADEAAVKFTSAVKMEPLSVGTTPLDGILTFLEAHKADSDTIFGPDGKNLADDILQISQLLYATADQYDSRVQAQDLIAQQNFAKADGGSVWTFAKPPGPGSTPAIPSADEASLIAQINEAQKKLDASNLKLKSLQWRLFAEWWKFVSEYIPDMSRPQRVAAYKAIVDPILQAIGTRTPPASGLLNTIDTLNTTIYGSDGKSGLQLQVDVKKAVKNPYYTRTDPTLCIAGLDSGWPQDFLNTLTVQLDPELTSDTSSVSKIFINASNPVPTDHNLSTTAMKLLAQCLLNSNTTNGTDGPAQTTGYQNWGNANPFVPLFIEWESIYYHIDKDLWDVKLRPSPVGHPNSQLRYVPNVELSDDLANQTDYRTLSGRIPVLPQPVFSLQNIVLSVINNASHDPAMTLTTDQINDLKKNIQQIKFISAPLSGLMNHLLTRVEGSHVKPNVRVQGQKVTPLTAAANASQDIDIGMDQLTLIGAESALTPYGTLMQFATNQYPKNPFKPVTHGQMLFTKLSIIDKFGQAVCVPTPKPRPRVQPTPPDGQIYPCLSDYLAPDVINGRLNTVFPSQQAVTSGTWPLCEYIQLTPSINQDSRINGSFLTRNDDNSSWREASEYENCVWGWIIINYAEGGLQFFTPDGTFYAEVRKGGVNNTNTGPKWLPFQPTGIAPGQLAGLLDLFSPTKDPDGSYLQAFFDLINGSIQNMPFPPSDYSAYANSIVGKPLALVNAGWSIEMAAPAIVPQNSLGNVTSDPQADLEAYQFALKIGDIERTYDGVVAYFESTNDANPSITAWDKLYTYFTKSPHANIYDLSDPVTGPTLYPKINPYYLDPDTTSSMTTATALNYHVMNLLIDPYTPIHAYSPILPTQSLTLPPWTVQLAMQKMHAFFHLGPVLLTLDVPTTYTAAKSSQQPVMLPVSGKKGTWSWLQPYATDDVTQLEPQYVPLPVQEDQGSTVIEKGPYTFLEGYLELMGSLAAK